jgi:two-component system cell cycle response regulator
MNSLNDPMRQPSILLVEDDENVLSLLQTHLERSGYEVSCASTLDEARMRLREKEDFDFVILDRRLPDGDGSSLCPLIRFASPHCYILMLTGDATPASKIEGFASGVDDYVTKPFVMEELLARIRAGMRIVGLQKELLASNRRFEALSLTDSLTAVSNRRAFDQEFATRFDHAIRYSRPLSMALIDLDHFKSVNDRLGHSAGDEVLRAVARVIEHGSRRSDFVARVGGEEFAVLLPETTLFEAFHFAEKVRESIAGATIHAQDMGRGVTVSIGIANTPHSLIASPQMLYDAADKALYRAKNRGRNRVECERRKVTVRESRGEAVSWSQISG